MEHQRDVGPEELSVPADTFASRLVLLRHDRGLTQKQAAEQCGLGAGSWSNWENGKHETRGMAEVVEAISKGLNVPRDWLMWGSTSARLFQTHLTALPSMLDHRYSSPQNSPPLLTLVRNDETEPRPDGD